MPDNAWGNEHCLEQMAGNNGWNDYNCGKRLRYICQKAMDPCARMNCGNGKCVPNGATASCSCSKGWTGNNCNAVVDPCQGFQCGNGKCVADRMIGGSARCICNKGWSGGKCDVVVDPCQGFNCGNGKCVADKMIGGSARCICNKGWSGGKCDVVVDPCQGFSCGNGKCVADKMIGGSARCVCNKGWSGSRCDVAVDPCEGVECVHGKCVANKMLGSVGSCSCENGWTGDKCDRLVDLCAKNPCQNGGKCVSNGKLMRPNYQCQCMGNFKGKNCEKSCKFEVTRAGLPAKLDAMILFDGSTSVGNVNYKKSLEFVSRLVSLVEIGNGKGRLEIAQFSNKFKIEIDFATSVTMKSAELKKKVAGIQYLMGGTFTGKALEQSFNIFKTQARKAKDVAKYLFVITDGTSHQVKEMKAAIAKLKGLGVELVAIGVGGGTNNDQLLLLAGGNAARVFSVGSFDQLNNSLISKLVENICE